MRSIVLAAAVACAVLPACAGAPAGQGTSPAESLYRQRCSGCHRPYEPGGRSRAAWAAAMDRMAPRAHLSPEQEGTLRHWLADHASDAGAAR